ncbi:restriction endonuclease subunit S [Aquirufa aurantiipilula]|uniref:restriction endonuclease subunit S n=1 Tax=Aquirufa aurantiipilula TaxID=2696561 RepID=UPI001CAA557A|nr:restriction endonuclease subunit S [Aquirufa aurantiipilula]MBZ1327001.1 hypothetical protein [Aquirufa aurantiipilula]
MSFNLKSTLKSDDIPFILPDNWSWYKWGDLITEYQQGLIRSNRELSESGTPYLKMNNLDNNGGYHLNRIEYTVVSKEELEKYRLHKDDFLLNVRNSKELVGKTCVIGNLNFNMVFNHMLVRIKHHEGISSTYINALLKIPVMRKFIDRCKSGTTTVIALYQRDLYDIPIPLPDKKTQDSIVAFVKNNYSKIELNNRINGELESMAKTIYDYWFVQFDFPDKNGKPYKTSGGNMFWNEELKREIPEGWEDGKLGDIAELVRGVTYDSSEIKSQNETGVIPILRATNVSGNVIDLNDMVYVPKENVSSSQVLNKYDILITMSSGSKEHIGKNGFFYFEEEVSFGAFCAKIVAKGEFRFYLYSYTQSDFMFTTIKNECLGTNINNLNGGLVKGFKILVPPDGMIESFNEIVSPLYEKIGNNLIENQKLIELRDWLLPMLMNGQVKVN